MAAGHLDPRRWPLSSEVDYVKLLLQRFRMRARTGVFGSKAQNEPGSVDFVSNSLALLMFASTVYLHVIPKASIEALQPEMDKFSAAPDGAGDEIQPTTPSPVRGVPAADADEHEEHDTPALAVLLGMSPHSSPEPPECSQSTSDDSENANGKRGVKSGTHREGRAREEPSKEESDLRWNVKSIKMYPSDEAQNAIADFFETCEARERECAEKGCTALAPYWRKGNGVCTGYLGPHTGCLRPCPSLYS